MKKLALLFLFLLCSSSFLYANRSKPFRGQEEADDYLVSHYNWGCTFFNQENWKRAADEFEKVIHFFPTSEQAPTACYYLAISYYKMREYDFANEEFSNYIKASKQPEYFEDAVRYKFCIAEHFKVGKKKRPFKMRYLPKWISGQDSALEIYDEVVAALPNHDLTVQALYAKAGLLRTMREYRDAIETYQLIIRRFPKNELVPTCYLEIADIYLEQSHYEFQNPDLLALAELNARKFKDDYPRDEKVALAESDFCQMKELYANGLYELGLFYERLGKPEASAIYFQSSIEEFPDTGVADLCRSRLTCLGYMTDEGEEADCCVEVAPRAAPPCIMQEDEEQGSAEYVHYSLLKKRDVPHCQECPCEVCRPTEQWSERSCNQNSYPENEEGDYVHYSLLKGR